MSDREERLRVLSKIEYLERQGIFDEDVEDDPEELELKPDQIDYLQKKLSSKILRAITLKKGKKFFENMEKNHEFVIGEIFGRENLGRKNEASIVTCNHFNAYDNYILKVAISPSLPHGRFFKVIREGNYTNPPKGLEMFMRHGDTLPLSRNQGTMKKFLLAAKTLLAKGQKILIYPEQSMWWNYRKPKPLKNGAYHLAVSNNVPIQPVFITMQDTEYLDKNGFPIQKHTVFILPKIYPEKGLSKTDNMEKMKAKNFEMWKDVYEKFYNQKLTYLCDQK